MGHNYMPQITIKSVIILTVYLKKILQELVGGCNANAYHFICCLRALQMCE